LLIRQLNGRWSRLNDRSVIAIGHSLNLNYNELKAIVQIFIRIIREWKIRHANSNKSNYKFEIGEASSIAIHNFWRKAEILDIKNIDFLIKIVNFTLKFVIIKLLTSYNLARFMFFTLPNRCELTRLLCIYLSRLFFFLLKSPNFKSNR
jgi:hypothetical protein